MLLWDRLKYFKESEFKSPEKVNGLLVFTLDVLREEIKRPIIVHCAYASSGHAPNSLHYTGNAVDFHVDGHGSLSAAEKIIYTMQKLGVLNYGLGVYPWWSHTAGFHLDLRAKLTYWISNEEKKYAYFQSSEAFLKGLMV